MIRRPPRSTRMTHSFPTRRSSDLASQAKPMASTKSGSTPCSAVDSTAMPGRRAAMRASSTGLCRSEEHTSELQSLMRISYAVFCLKKKKIQKQQSDNDHHRLLQAIRHKEHTLDSAHEESMM